MTNSTARLARWVAGLTVAAVGLALFSASLALPWIRQVTTSPALSNKAVLDIAGNDTGDYLVLPLVLLYGFAALYVAAMVAASMLRGRAQVVLRLVALLAALGSFVHLIVELHGGFEAERQVAVNLTSTTISTPQYGLTIAFVGIGVMLTAPFLLAQRRRDTARE